MVSMNYYSLVLVVVALVWALAAVAGDPDILGDFIVPAPMVGMPPTNITSDFFTYTDFLAAKEYMPWPPQYFIVIKANMEVFPALNGQSVSYAMLVFPSRYVNPPHTHQRAAELLFVQSGALSVGFVDTAGKLYTQVLVAGDIFVFPKGLVHYQYNQGPNPATAFSAFGSAAPGTVNVPASVFGTGIDDAVLAKSFKTDFWTVQKLKAALTPPPKK
ncbi:putative germin-like protein 9-2 [Triticum urartu]|nr:putative germin-like protein 9-2 [Triticum urartu]